MLNKAASIACIKYWMAVSSEMNYEESSHYFLMKLIPSLINITDNLHVNDHHKTISQPILFLQGSKDNTEPSNTPRYYYHPRNENLSKSEKF